MLENRDGRKLLEVRAIIIHDTGNPSWTLEKAKKRWETGEAGAQYFVDKEGEVYKTIPEDEYAAAVGATQDGYTELAKSKFKRDNYSGNYPVNPNLLSVSIEMQTTDMDGNTTKATYNSTVDLTAQLVKKHNLSVETDILRHQDITGKIDPNQFAGDDNKKWDKFKNDVKDKLNPKLDSNQERALCGY